MTRETKIGWFFAWFLLLGWVVWLSAQTANNSNTSNLAVLSGSDVTIAGAVTAGVGSPIGWTGRSKITSTADGNVVFTNNAGTGTGNMTLILGPAGGDNKTPVFLGLYQTNPVVYLRDAAGVGTANLIIEAQKATTGVRYVCINTSGQLVSQQAACSGT